MRTRVFTSRAWLVLAILFSALGCNLSEDQTSRSLSEEPSACTLIDATMPVYGPAEFSRDTGKPKTDYATFEAPLDGEVCVVVVNGLHDPPHGKRISSAWIRIDGNLAIDPDAFSQEVDRVTKPFPVAAGEHELSVKLASKPGSFITVELMFLPADTEPPEISIVPEDGSLVSTDMPLVRIEYTDDITGVDLESLSIFMNGSDVTERFQVDEAEAEWQITIDSYLEEGPNEMNVTLSDRIGNTAVENSSFQVHTPTDVLIEDLDRPDPRYRRRSAYKLLYRLDEISLSCKRRCLKQLNETPEPKAADRLLDLVQSSEDNLTLALATGALGEAARVDPPVGQRPDVLYALCGLLFNFRDSMVKAVAARSLGLMQGQAALGCLDNFLDNGPNEPSRPEICVEHPDARDCLQYESALMGVNLQVTRAAIRIAGEDHSVGNPGDMGQAREEYLRRLQELLSLLGQ